MNVKLQAFFELRGASFEDVSDESLTRHAITYMEHLERENAALKHDLRLADGTYLRDERRWRDDLG